MDSLIKSAAKIAPDLIVSEQNTDMDSKMDTTSTPINRNMLLAQLNELSSSDRDFVLENLKWKDDLINKQKQDVPAKKTPEGKPNESLTNITNFLNQATTNTINRPHKRQNVDPATTKNLSENQDFIFPPPRKISKKANIINNNPTQTNNSFTVLKETELNENNDNEQPINVKDTPRIKPISMLRTEDWKQVIEEIANKADKNFIVKPNATFIKILPATILAHRNIATFLKDNNKQCIVLDQGTARPLKIVIRGLPADTEKEEVIAALTAIHYPPIKVNQLLSRKEATRGKPLPPVSGTVPKY